MQKRLRIYSVAKKIIQLIYMDDDDIMRDDHDEKKKKKNGNEKLNELNCQIRTLKEKETTNTKEY